MPTYLLEYPGAEPRLVEARRPIDARRHAAKSFKVRTLTQREAFDYGRDGGIDLETAGSNGSASTPEGERM